MRPPAPVPRSMPKVIASSFESAALFAWHACRPPSPQGSRLQLAAVSLGCPRDERSDEERLAGVGALLDVREREQEGLLDRHDIKAWG